MEKKSKENIDFSKTERFNVLKQWNIRNLIKQKKNHVARVIKKRRIKNF